MTCSYRFIPLLTITSLFATDCCSTHEPCCSPSREVYDMAPGYNAPNRIAVDECTDIFSNGEFIYWVPVQENMELGYSGSRFSSTTERTKGTWINSDFKYKPGFKIGLGMNLDRDHWDLYGRYTWVRGTHITSKILETGGAFSISPRFTIPTSASSTFFGAKQSWRLEMDIADLALRRHCSVGTALSFHPFLGLRGAWIRQDLKNEYFQEVTSNLSHENIFVSQKSKSWGLGPRIGLDLNWGLGCGFRLYGNGGTDLLFTRYTSLTFDQEAESSGVIDQGSSYQFRQGTLDLLRHHLDLELGFGWGRYFACEKWHFDLRAGYAFEAFFDQNMFRSYLDNIVVSKSVYPNGNLFAHGLNVRMRLDF